MESTRAREVDSSARDKRTRKLFFIKRYYVSLNCRVPCFSHLTYTSLLWLLKLETLWLLKLMLIQMQRRAHNFCCALLGDSIYSNSNWKLSLNHQRDDRTPRRKLNLHKVEKVSTSANSFDLLKSQVKFKSFSHLT